MTGRKRHSSRPQADPYDPSSPDYAERHRATEIDIGGGMTRFDYGEPANGPRPKG